MAYASSIVQISLALLPGTQYYLLVTSYANAAVGPYTGSISNTGPGTAVFGLVPEPSTYAMMLGGLAAAALVARRRRA